MDLNLINTNVNRLITDMDSVINYASGREYERVIQLGRNTSSRWSKVGELRGVSDGNGADLTFSVKNANREDTLKRQELKVMASQRNVNGFSIKVYSLGEPWHRGVTIGYVQLNAFDFDIYLKRDSFSSCSVVGQNSGFNGTFDNFGEVTTEPTGIVYVPTHTILNTDMDTGWLPLTLLNGWISYPAPFHFLGIRKMPDGVVVMGGLVRSGTTTTPNDICVLPVGYRPLTATVFCVQVDGGTHSIELPPNGAVTFRNQGTGNPGSWLSLSGISFLTN